MCLLLFMPDSSQRKAYWHILQNSLHFLLRAAMQSFRNMLFWRVEHFAFWIRLNCFFSCLSFYYFNLPWNSITEISHLDITSEWSEFTRKIKPTYCSTYCTMLYTRCCALQQTSKSNGKNLVFLKKVWLDWIIHDDYNDSFLYFIIFHPSIRSLSKS